ncbi:neural Wiskott-Aldrich syndrome protein [Homalodisca vitripennis]|uniref:neural Wiskott-Aldrich syndrome protein n=1 Tax=Homalodisca vitripennis TaxID=197043 RepID=UPI001EEC73E1|nr:neural Wiskott-Aldrich syndrome protein [Homalodisca vitripennis]
MGSHLEQNMASPDPSLKPSMDLRPADLVTRLLAATPPYLYTMPLSNSFFFSEMLRSFVQARTSPPGGPRRGRKRSWKEARQPPQNDKPLELTTNPKPPPSPPVKSESPPKEVPQSLLLPPCNLLSLPSSDPILPPPTAPLWYPHMNMYPPPPPQCFDPHFFVDLRVSGHIWDRKAEKDSPPSEPLNLQTEEKKNVLNLSFRKHNSAFSVPQPRELQERERTSEKSTCGTNYVLQNLDKIYKEVKTKQETKKEQDEEELTPEEKKVRDLRALIGLELVVDYVKQEDTPGEREVRDDSSDSSDSNQEPLVMD